MTFGSVYEILTAITAVRKQKFWDWFDGDDLRAIWTKTNIQGTGTFAMIDAVDEGFSVTCGTAQFDESQITFNNIRHYVQNACVMLAVFKALSTTGVRNYCGLENALTTLEAVEKACYVINGLLANTSLRTADATTSSETQTSVSDMLAVHGVKIECGSADIRLYEAGNLEVTKTTNRPTVKLQPCFGVRTTLASSPKEVRMKYCEVYNT